ncbi:glycosyltransferase family A protein [Gryllotalpicola kribbensis]|uniref:Glycosyltransferase family A protein n=1 Tax=Gryllotalpicola kribbensis TaxID=993084 RepID=A0ABP8AP65_9MICO
MLAFITSLRHPLNSSDYAHVEELLAQTLGSVTAQTSDDFAVFVVGNRMPDFELPRRTTFVPVDFPPPVATSGPRFALGPFVRDKGTKIGIGLAAARAVHPDHVMIFDADDFVHRGLAALSQSAPTAPGWVVEEGLIYSRTRQAWRVQRDFNRTCGTCHVVAWEAYGVPDDLEVTATQDEVAAAFGERLERIIGAHRQGREWLAEHGYPLEPLPFHGAVYHVDTGENHSGKGLRGLARPLSDRVVRDFGIPRLASPSASIGRALDPRELAYTAQSALSRATRITKGALARQAKA